MAFESATPPFYTGEAADRNRIVDEAARNWSLELEAARVSPEVTFGSLIMAGCSPTNYMVGRESETAASWGPAIENIDGRSFVRLTNLSSQVLFGAEGLKAGIKNAMKIKETKTLGNEGLQMVPYPRFDDDGKFRPDKTRIILLSDRQVEELRNLLGMGPSDPGAAEFAKRMGWDKVK